MFSIDIYSIERGATQYKWRRHRFLALKQRLAIPGSRTGERAQARAGIFPICCTAGKLPEATEIYMVLYNYSSFYYRVVLYDFL
jgi:hypothetical protein